MTNKPKSLSKNDKQTAHNGTYDKEEIVQEIYKNSAVINAASVGVTWAIWGKERAMKVALSVIAIDFLTEMYVEVTT